MMKGFKEIMNFRLSNVSTKPLFALIRTIMYIHIYFGDHCMYIYRYITVQNKSFIFIPISDK